MIEHHFFDSSQAAAWQTVTSVVQAAVSISLLIWYVLAAHWDRARTRRERDDDFASLVRLCRDLGREAKEKTKSHRCALPADPVDAAALQERLALWKADMGVVYVCLNEVPHYEVRNPAFSTALTRLWMEVDARAVDPGGFNDPALVMGFLDRKFDRICVEVDEMAALLANCDNAPVMAGRMATGMVKRLGIRTRRRVWFRRRGFHFDHRSRDQTSRPL